MHDLQRKCAWFVVKGGRLLEAWNGEKMVETPTPLEIGGNAPSGCRDGHGRTAVQPPPGHSVAIARPPCDRLVAVELPAWKPARHRNQKGTMKTSMDYTKLAATLDYVLRT